MNSRREQSPAGNCQTLHIRHQLTGHAFPVDAVCFNSFRYQILTADRHTLRLWSLRKEVKQVSLLPATLRGRQIDSKEEKPKLQALVIALFHDPRHDLYTAVFGGDPRVDASEGNQYVNPGIVRVYHASLAVLMEFTAHAGPVLASCFNTSNSQLVTSSTSLSVKVWSYRQTRPKPTPGNTLNSNAKCASPMNAKGTELALSHIYQDHDRPVGVLCVSSCGKLLLGTGGTDLWIWNLKDSVLVLCVRSLHNFKTDLITSLLYDSSLNQLTAGYDDGVIAVWQCNISTASAPKETTNEKATPIDGGGKRALQPTLLREYESHDGRVHSIERSSNSRWLFSCGIDGLICHHDALHGSRLGGLKCSSIVRAAYTGIRREYPPSLLKAVNVKSPFGRRLFVISVSGAVISIVEIQSPQWECNSVRDSVLHLSLRRGEETDMVAAMLPSNEICIIDGVKGSRIRQTVIPLSRNQSSKPSLQKKNRGLQGSASTSLIGMQKSQLVKGRAPLIRSVATEDSLLSKSLTLERGKDKIVGRLTKSRGEISTSITMAQWWNSRDALVLGWSDGAIEIVETVLGGRRIKLLTSKSSNESAVASICIANTSCNSKDRSCMQGKSHDSPARMPQKLANQAWSQNEVSSVATHAPISELAGPWGGPVRFKKSAKHRFGAKNKELKRLEASFTIVSGDLQGALSVWSPRQGKLISTQNGHSGSIVVVDFLLPHSKLISSESSDEVFARVISIAPGPRRECFVSASADGIVKVWNLSRGGKLNMLSFFLAQPQPGDGLQSTTQSRKATLTTATSIPGTSILMCGFDNGVLQGWQLETNMNAKGNEQELEARKPFWNNHHHSQTITAIRASKCGRKIVSASADATVVIWGLTTRRRTLQAGEGLGHGQLCLHVVELNSLTVSLAVSDLCFVGNENALLACMGGKLYWLDGSHQSLEMSYGAAAPESRREYELQQPQDLMMQDVVKTKETSTDNCAASPGDEETSSDQVASLSLSSSKGAVSGAYIRNEFPYSGYKRSAIPSITQVSKKLDYPGRTNGQIYIPMTMRSDTSPLLTKKTNANVSTFSSWGLRREDTIPSIPSHYSSSPTQKELLPVSKSTSPVPEVDRSMSPKASYPEPISDDNSHYVLRRNLAQDCELKPPSTRGSLRPFTSESSATNNTISASKKPDKHKLGEKTELREELRWDIPHTTQSSSDFKPHPYGPNSTIAPVSGTRLSVHNESLEVEQFDMIFKLLEAEIASLEPSENGTVSLTDIPRLLSSMQVTTSTVPLGNHVTTYPLYLVWEIYQRVIRWHLDIEAVTRNVVQEPTMEHELKRIQNRCNKTRIDKQAIKKIFVALMTYVRQHPLQKKTKTFLQRRSDNSQFVVEYNSIGEKSVKKREVAISESLTFREMYRDMSAREKRARAASLEHWEKFLTPVILGISASKGMTSIPPVRWRLSSFAARIILKKFMKRECGISEPQKAPEYVPWPALPETLVRQHALQLRTLPKESREQNVMPSYESETVQSYPLNALMHLIDQILLDKEADDLVQDRHGHPRQGLASFFYEWHLRNYGLPSLAGVKIASFLRSILDYREVPLCRIFAHLLGAMGRSETSNNSFVKSGRQASSTLNLFLDARQWIIRRDQTNHTAVSKHLVDFIYESPKYPTAALTNFQVPLVSIFRLFECIRALFSGPSELLNRIEAALLDLPEVTVETMYSQQQRYVQRGLALETLLYVYEEWVKPDGVEKAVSKTGSKSIAHSEINVTIPTLDFKKESDQNARVISSIKQLLDDFMLADETSGHSIDGKRSGSLTFGSFQAAICSSSIWGGQDISDHTLQNIRNDFSRDGKIAYLEFWSNLYQYVTSTSVSPLEKLEDGPIVLPVSLLEHVHAKSPSTKHAEQPLNVRQAYSNASAKGGHGKSTVPVPLKALTERMSSMVPLFSTNLDMESTTTVKYEKTFHNGTIESSASIQLLPSVSHAPERHNRADALQHNLIADHGEHSRYALKPTPKKKHPSSQKRMNMAILHQQSLNRLRFLDNYLQEAKGTETTETKVPTSENYINGLKSSVTKSALQVVMPPQSNIDCLPDSATNPDNLVDHMTRAVTPSLHMKARRAIMSCDILEKDQREAALFAMERHRSVHHYMNIMQLLFEDVDANNIRKGAHTSSSSSNSISAEELRKLVASISGAYKIPMKKRNAAKSVLASATTKAEVVSIQISLLAAKGPIEIIRESDNILRTAVSIDVDRKLQQRLVSALKLDTKLLALINAEVKEKAIEQAEAATTGSQLLTSVYGLFTAGFDPNCGPNAFHSVDEKGALLERSMQLLKEALLLLPRNYVSESQLKVAMTALAESTTTTEATLVFVTILEGQHSTVVHEQVRAKREEISSLADSVRSASRSSSRPHLAILQSPSLEDGLGSPPLSPHDEQRSDSSSRPGSRGPSTRLYPEAYRSQPPLWEASRQQPSRTNSPHSQENSEPFATEPTLKANVGLPNISHSIASKMESTEDSDERDGHKISILSQSKQHEDSMKQAKTVKIRNERITRREIMSNRDEGGIVSEYHKINQMQRDALNEKNFVEPSASPQDKSMLDVDRRETTSAASNEATNDEDLPSELADEALLAAIERADDLEASDLAGRATRAAMIAEMEAAARAEVESAIKMDNTIAGGKIKSRVHKEANTDVDIEEEARRLSIQFEAKAREEMKVEAEMKRKAEAEAKSRSKREKEEKAAKAKREKEEKAEKAKHKKEEKAAKAKREKEEKVAKAKREKEEKVAKAKREQEENEAKAKREQEEREAIAKREQQERKMADAKFDSEYEAELKLNIEKSVAAQMKKERSESETISENVLKQAGIAPQAQDEQLNVQSGIVSNDEPTAESDISNLKTVQDEDIPNTSIENTLLVHNDDIDEADRREDASKAEEAAANTAAAVAELEELEKNKFVKGKKRQRKLKKKKMKNKLKEVEKKSTASTPEEPEQRDDGIVLATDIQSTPEGDSKIEENTVIDIGELKNGDSSGKEQAMDSEQASKLYSSEGASAAGSVDDPESEKESHITGNEAIKAEKSDSEDIVLNDGFLQHTMDLLAEQKDFLSQVKEGRESEVVIEPAATEEVTRNWYEKFQELCVSDEEDSDGMDSGNDEFGVSAVIQVQAEAEAAAKKAALLEALDKVEAANRTAREKAIAEKEAENARKKAEDTQKRLEAILQERRQRELRRAERLKRHAIAPVTRSMNMDGLNPEYGLSFSENIKFQPFQLMKGPTSVPPWDEYDAAEESDSPDDAEEEEEAKLWRTTRNRVVSAVKEGKLKSIMTSINDDVLPENWESAPRMFKLEHSLWRPFFRNEEEELLQEIDVAEEKELDVMAKRLEEQKAALLAGELFDQAAEEERKEKKIRARGHWGKIRMHVKTKWRLSKSLRKSRMKSSVVKPLISGKQVNDIIAKGKTKEDELSSFRYYSLKVDSEHAIVTITVTSTQGDPDLYVSNNILPSTGEQI